MDRDLVPMRVRVYARVASLDRRRKVGQADWPNLNRVDADLRAGLPWTVYIKARGSDWLGHDRVENLGTGHDYGQWLAMVPHAFAEAAHELYPHLVEVLSESAAREFYNARCAVDTPDVDTDDAELARIYQIAMLEEVGVAPPASDEELARRRESLDPDAPGGARRRNVRADYDRLKAARGWGGRMRHGWTPRPRREPPRGWAPGHGE